MVFARSLTLVVLTNLLLVHQVQPRTWNRQDLRDLLDTWDTDPSVNVARRVEKVDNICKVTNPVSNRQLVSNHGNAFMCDTASDGGGWILIQSRHNGDVNFYKDWASYRTGFGNVNGDFWLGLQNIHLLCHRGCDFRVDFAYNGRSYYDQYTSFSVAGENDRYQLRLFSYLEGNTGRDSLMAGIIPVDSRGNPNARDIMYTAPVLTANYMQFSTYDSDNDLTDWHCATLYNAGWWWNSCGATNPNGPWRRLSDRDGRFWMSVTGWWKHSASVMWTELKVRVSSDIDWSRLNTQEISLTVNGGYSSWSAWSLCTQTCGGGTQTRRRSCDNPAPGLHGKKCDNLGPDVESSTCNQQKCPVNGGYSSWSAWSLCTQTCGGGTQTRRRSCDNPAPGLHGKKCDNLGPDVESSTCNQQKCPASTTAAPSTASTTAAPSTNCPVGFDLVGGRCLMLMENSTPYAEARDNCAKIGARLTTPTTEDLFKSLMSWDKISSRSGSFKVWLGCSNIGQGDLTNYVWEDDDRTPLSQTWSDFKGNQDRPTNKGWEKCVTGRMSSPQMQGFHCKNRSFPSVCEIQLAV